ncbi:MAG: hypothetical protein COX48_01265 [bacterium (Candidatus Stahlbacteria) CG23_combo_of_CG06-09_8_20_14_all_34_7]|nr:MAG: hypothetical protein COX48_01265 [bacterium (Candidatus Stahlbacteria) CG23_combo_of_CG06-09_8_20_14_all_34_7]
MNSSQKNRKKRVRFSQHFLTDSNVLGKIEDAMETFKYKTAVEAGPGRGAITKIILRKEPKILTLIERDESLIEKLKEEYKACKIQKRDILDYNITEDVFVSSVPYSITREILLLLCRSNSVKISYLIIQKEVSEKILLLHPIPISVYVRTFFKIEKIFNIKKNSFTPIPTVESSFLKLNRKYNFTSKHSNYWSFLTRTLSGKNKSAEYLNPNYKGRRVSELNEKELLRTYVDKDIHSH